MNTANRPHPDKQPRRQLPSTLVQPRRELPTFFQLGPSTLENKGLQRHITGSVLLFLGSKASRNDVCTVPVRAKGVREVVAVQQSRQRVPDCLGAAQTINTDGHSFLHT